MLFALSKNRIQNKNHGLVIGTEFVTFKLKQEHEFLSDPSDTIFQILFSAPKIEVKITNYERTIDCPPSIIPLIRSVIYLTFARKDYTKIEL